MESSQEQDVFSQGLEDDNDPFALADSEFEQAREGAVTDEPVPGVAVVNAEGQPVTAGDAPAEGSILAAQDPTSGAPASAAAAPATPPVSSPPAPTAPPVATPPANEPVTSAPVAATSEPVAPIGAPAEDPEQAAEQAQWEAEKVKAEEVQPTPVAEDPPTAPTAGAETAQPVEPQPTPATPEPDPKKKAKAPAGQRRYLLLKPESGEKFSVLSWYEDARGRIVEKGSEGAKRASSVLARGQEDALHVGYAVLGSPPDGVKLAAVAESYLQVKHVAPEPDAPIRVKLAIR